MDVVRTCRRQRKLKWNKGNYQKLVNFKLPRRDSKNKLNWKRNVSGTSARGNLFPIKVLQKEGSKVKVHYIKYDEWKDVKMIADKSESIQEQTQDKNLVPEEPQSIVYKPYSLMVI